MASVADMYAGILPASTAGNGGLTTRSVSTVPIDPRTGMPAKAQAKPPTTLGDLYAGIAPASSNGASGGKSIGFGGPAVANYPSAGVGANQVVSRGGSTISATAGRPTPAQLQQMQAVPDSAYMWPQRQPINTPGTPNGTQYADTGDRGRATPEMRQPLGLPITLADIMGPHSPWGAASGPAPVVPERRTLADLVAPIPATRHRRGWDMPADDSLEALSAYAERKWANEAERAAAHLGAGGSVAGPAHEGSHHGGQSVHPQPVLSQSTNGYVYQRMPDGSMKQVAVADWAKNLTPEQQYEQANRNGQLAAQQRAQAARASGAMTPVEQIRATTGASPSQAYAQANQQAAARAQASSGRSYSGSWATGETSGSPFW